MEITNISKKNLKLYELEINNKINIEIHEDILIENVLYKGKIIKENELINLLDEQKLYMVYDKIKKMIQRKLKTKYEVVTILNKNDITPEESIKILRKLELSGLIDDERYTDAFIHDKLLLTNYGPYRIFKMLKDRGLNINIIKDKLNEIDENIWIMRIKKIVQKKAKNEIISDPWKYKMLNKLYYLGYDIDTCKSVIQSINFN